jgi:hypothetical protein
MSCPLFLILGLFWLVVGDGCHGLIVMFDTGKSYGCDGRRVSVKTSRQRIESARAQRTDRPLRYPEDCLVAIPTGLGVGLTGEHGVDLPAGCLPRRPGGGRWAEPQGCPGGLHGLVDHGQQLTLEGVQVDLVAQAHGELLHGPGGVVRARLKRRSTRSWTRRRNGWNSATAARVAAATARLPDP